MFKQDENREPQTTVVDYIDDEAVDVDDDGEESEIDENSDIDSSFISDSERCCKFNIKNKRKYTF